MKVKNKNTLIAISLLLIFALIYLLNRSDKNPADVSVGNTSAADKTLLALAKDSSVLNTPHLSDEEKQSECRKSLEDIESLPMKTLIYDLSSENLILDANCLFLGNFNKELLQNFPHVCLQLVDGRPSDDCVNKLLFYKSMRILRATMGENIEALSTDVLVSQFIGLAVEQGFLSAEGLGKIREVGNALYLRLPESQAAATAAVIGYVADNNLSNENSLARDQLLDEVRQKFPENWQIYEMDLLRKKARDENEFKAAVLGYYRNNQTSPIGLYYMGCIEWIDAETDSAIRYFRSASEKAPSDRRFRQSLEKALSSRPPAVVCNVEINFYPEGF